MFPSRGFADMGTKASLFLAVFTAVSLFTSLARAADPAVRMPTGIGGGMPDDLKQPFDQNPTDPNSLTRRFLKAFGKDPDENTVPLKTLRITNNTANTIYPIMRDPNSNKLASDPAVGQYDPYDPPDKEYRGYIGYEEGGVYYFGLKPGASILVSIPLVFWNAARISIGTDRRYLTPTGKPNPLQYDQFAYRSITKAETSNNTIPNGVVMWYRALTPPDPKNPENTAEAPRDDSEDQLAEWTIRDHGYLSNPQITAKTKGEIPDNQLVTLINYDVSNVDNLYLPLAMEALDAWVLPQGSGTGPTPNRTGWSPGMVPDVYGWTGAINTIKFLQDHIAEFTKKEDNQFLGEYFGEKKRGWPFYNIPNPENNPNPPRKIPSGANIFAQSPLKNVPSSYGDGVNWQNDKYILSSGGTDAISVTIGWAGGTPDQAGSTTLHLNKFADNEKPKIAFLAANFKDYVFTVEGRPPLDANQQPLRSNPIQNGTVVLDVDEAAGTVTLSKPLIASSESVAFKFDRTVDDYASKALIRLWFSWAQYYLKNTPATLAGPKQIPGSIKAMTATLKFAEPHPELVKGMAVTSPVLDDVMTEVDKHEGNAVILEIASDQKSVILSQVVGKDDTGPFTVHPLPSPANLKEALKWTPVAGDPGYPLIGDKFNFAGDPTPPNPMKNPRDPYEFSQQVYLIMASMNQIGKTNNDSVFKFMQDVIGGNMGFIFTNEAKKWDETDMVTGMIRDMIKSVLRGVSDFTKYQDDVDAQGNHTNWYPNPADHRGGQRFNVFNLDPFVWFVHVQLGFSGYGFSLDDDTADVGAGGASNLQLTVTGTGGLPNTNQWAVQAPFGPIKNVSLQYSGAASPTNGDTQYFKITGVSHTTPMTVTTDAPNKLSNGTTIIIDSVQGEPAANNTFQARNVTKFTFDLYDYATGTVPVAPTGAYAGNGRWGYYPFRPYVKTGADLTKVYHRVLGDDASGVFQGVFVSVNSVDRNPNKPMERFRVWQRGRTDEGRLIFNTDLTDAKGNALGPGTYSFTFFGIAEPAVGGGIAFDETAAAVERLRDRLDDARDIKNDEKRQRKVERIRDWLEIVSRGNLDPNSREAKLRRKLQRARDINDPDRRKKLVQRLTRKLEKLR